MTEAQRSTVRDALREALALHQAGELSRARPLYEMVLGIDPAQARALHMLGLIVMVADGDLPAAISLLERSIELSDEADTHVNLANFFWQAGQREQAMAHWDYALQMQPLAGGVATRARYADTAYSAAMEAYNAGDVERCKQLLVAALRLAVEAELLHYPVEHFPPPHQDGAAAFRQSNLQLTHAIRMTQADSWLHLGILYEQEDELALALVCYQRGLLLQPDPLDDQQPQHLQLATIRSETLNYRMQLLSRTRQMDDNPLSKQRLRQAEDEADGLSVDRGLQRHKRLVEYLHKSCHWPQAQRLAQLILDDAIFHSPAYRFLFDNSTQILDERRRYDAALTELLQDASMAGLWSQPLGLEWCRFRFYLAYHGLNDRQLNEKLAQVYLHLAPSLAYTAPHLRPGQLVRYDGVRKIRVGFISAFLTYHPVGRTLQGYVQHLPRSRFEVTVFFITLQPNVEHDSLLLQMQRWADHFVPLPVERTQQARELVEQQRPDVLLYGDIGMEPTSFFLAFSRLAPVQALTFGHPDTSGLSTIDYFLSHPNMDEPQRGQDFYSERLVQLPGIGFWHKADVPSRFLSREDVGLADHQLGLPAPPLPAGARYAWSMYLVTKSIQFYSPDFMDCVARILHAHPASFVALVVDIGRQSRGFDLHNECQETILSGIESRLHALDSEQPTSAAASSPPVPILQRQRLSGRVRFIDKGDHDYFMSLLSMTDVLLQPMPLDGTTTTLEAVSLATPTVLFEGPMIGGRMGSAIYRHMNVTACIAGSLQQYVDIAVRLGTDRAFNAQLRQSVRDNSERHRVFQDERAVQALADFLHSAVSEAR